MSKGRILVVENEAVVAADIRQQLTQLDYDVTGIAGNGDGAVAAARRQQPDLVLMDIRLPGDMDGIDAAAAITSERDVPVVYLTAYADPQTLDRAKLTEPFGYILKPFEPNELNSVIEVALYRHRQDSQRRADAGRFRALSQCSPDVIAAFDARCRILYMNPAVGRLFAPEVGDCVGRGYAELGVPSPEAQRQETAIRAVFESGRPSRAEGRLCASRPDLWLDVCYVPHFGADGTVASVIAVARDISDLIARQETVIRAEQMAATGVLAAGIAHAFNNIHTGLIGYLEMVLGSAELPPAERHRLVQAQTAARRAAQLTRHLASFACAHGGRHRFTSLNDVVADTLPLVAGDLEAAAVELRTGAERCPPVRVCPAAVRQALLNILVNAVEAMHDSPHRRLTVSTGSRAGEAWLRVTDTGRGIDPDDLRRIFLPFWSGRGLHAQPDVNPGLGLSIANSIAREHGGRIDVDSTPGKGSSFTIVLPAATFAPGEPAVLVYCPEPVVRGFVADVLDHLDHDHVATGSPEDALAWQAELAVPVAVVDARTDAGAARRLVEQLGRSRRPPAVVVTGSQDPAAWADLAPAAQLGHTLDVRRLRRAVDDAMVS